MSTISDEVYRRTEGVLFRYAKSKMIIARLESELAELETQIENIEKLIAACSATPGSMIANYSGMPAGGAGSSTVERAAIISESRSAHLEMMYQDKCRKRDQKLERLYLLREATTPTEYAYQQLDTQDQHIFTQRYFYCRSNEAIGLQLHCDERTVRRRRQAMIARLAEVLELENAPNMRRIV